MNQRKSHIDALGAVLLVYCSASMGINQVLVKLVNEGLAPVFQAGLRSACAFLPVLLFAVVTRRRLTLSDGSFWPGIVAGLFFAFEFLLADGSLAPDLRGTAFAVAAAVIMAAMLITSESSLKNYDNFVVLLYALATVTVIIAGISLTLVPLEWPSGQEGWIVFSASSVFYVMATFTLFKAVAMAGPLRTAIIDNTSPVWASLFAFLLLEQAMSDRQLLGMVLVVGAVIALQASSSRTAEGIH